MQSPDVTGNSEGLIEVDFWIIPDFRIPRWLYCKWDLFDVRSGSGNGDLMVVGVREAEGLWGILQTSSYHTL